MRILVFGAGAIGSLFGAHLASRHEVTLLCREEHARSVNEQGLRITGISDMLARPRAVTDPGEAGDHDLVLLTVKANDTGRAAELLARNLGPGIPVVSMQNGLGNAEILAGHLPHNPIIAGITSQGAIFRSPGMVEHTGKSYTMVGGPGAVEVAEMLTASGIDAEARDDIEVEIWYKALVNAVINPLGTLMRDRNGLVLRDTRLQPLARQVIAEGVEVARARGIDLDPETAWQRLVRVATETAENICSMRQDVERGRRTEIDQLNGAIVRYGAEQGIPAPVNGLLAALVRVVEKTTAA